MADAAGAGPAAGLRVVDCSTTETGALCTMLLADQGATVVMVEPEGGHPLRRLPVGRVWLRGKRSVRAAAVEPEALYELADVVVTGSPDGGGAVLPPPSPRLAAWLVLCDAGGALGPFAADADLVMAATGIMAHQSGFREGPVYLVPPVVTAAAALLAMQGICAALYRRERTGNGDRVSVPLLFGSLAQQCAYLTRTERPSPLGQLRRNAYGQLPLYRLYQCADGRWLHLGLINARFWPKLCLAIGPPDLISDPRFQSAVRFETHEQRRSLMDLLAGIFVRRPYADWDRVFDEMDVPCAPACTADEFAVDPQVLFRHGIVRLAGADGAEERQPGLALLFAGGPREPRGGAPALGAHDGDPWGEMPKVEPVTPPAAAQPARSIPASARGPLAGVRILDVSAYIAGPLGPAQLADLGADVIKIEGPDGDGLRGGNAGFTAWNRGKRGLCLDLRTEEGRAIIHRLAVDADVLVDNMRPGVGARLGVDYATLSVINPRLVHCYVSTYGSDGPYRHKPGVDPLLQARSGIERVQGGPEHPPVFLLLAATDNTCAMTNAAGIALALWQRERTGRGLYFETSLLQAALLLQSDPLLDYPDRPPVFVNGYEQTGRGPLRRLYRCANGWIFLAAAGMDGSLPEERWQALCDAAGRPQLAGDPCFAAPETRALYLHDLADLLEEAFVSQGVRDLLARLAAAGVPAADATERFIERFVPELGALDESLLVTREHPLLGAITTPGVLVRLEQSPGHVQASAPLLGEHTHAILAEAGYDEATITALRERGVIGWGFGR